MITYTPPTELEIGSVIFTSTNNPTIVKENGTYILEYLVEITDGIITQISF